MRMKTIIASFLLAGAAHAETWSGRLWKTSGEDNFDGLIAAQYTETTTLRVAIKWGNRPKMNSAYCVWADRYKSIAYCRGYKTTDAAGCSEAADLVLSKETRRLGQARLINTRQCGKYWSVVTYDGSMKIR